MKKIYALFLVISSLSYGQLLSEDFNYADNALLTANGWSAHSGAGTQAIDVGASNGLTYSGYSGTTGTTGVAEGNAARLDNTGEDVNKAFNPSTAVTSGPLYISFLVNVSVAEASGGYFFHLGTAGSTANWACRLFVKNSTTAGKVNFGIANNTTASYTTTDYDLNTTYLIIIRYDVSTSGNVSLWVKSAGVPATEVDAGAPNATNSGSGVASINAAFLRQYNAAQNITVDGLRVYTTWMGTTACPLQLTPNAPVCDATTLNIDTYTVTIPFTGGNSGTYNLSTTAGTISGDNPSTTATGNIIVSGITEGTGAVLTVTGGCSFTLNLGPHSCKPVNALPYYEDFNYAIGAALGTQQKWFNVNTGDEILMTNALTYTGLPNSGNAAGFDGAGIDCFTTLTSQATGTVYYSLLVNTSTLAGVTDTNGGYFAGFGETTTNLGATLWAKRIDDSSYNLGVEVRTANGTNTTYDTTTLNAGTTYFIVVAYTFADTGTADDTVKLWINPAITATESTPTLTDTHTGTDLLAINNFFLRQDSVTETGFVVVDEVRVGTTWTDVVPQSAGLNDTNITGLKVYPNPVSNGILNITSANLVEKTVTIYDGMGKQVFAGNTSNYVVNISNLTSGIYMVKITEEGKTATRKIVVE